ncbi:MAG: aminotransferase class I/II-fold pyridoxal phosphate-dependent enzyme, partial [Rhodoferax sp.]|nr:aminotransferase class I/II-fold pyridoxal phosphate-dependent enzyme [Rhodoferax sp.]
VSEALDLACRAFINPGEKVMFHQPCYVSYHPSISLTHGTGIAVPTFAKDNFALTAEALRAAWQPGAKIVETAIYNTLPDNLDALLRQHPVRCPVSFIGGTHSAEMKQVGMALTQRVTQGRILMIDGSHLFPMEKPLATAAAIETTLLNMN